MYCPHCGSQQPDNAVVCSACGRPLVARSQAGAPQQVAQQPWGSSADPLGYTGTVAVDPSSFPVGGTAQQPIYDGGPSAYGEVPAPGGYGGASSPAGYGPGQGYDAAYAAGAGAALQRAGGVGRRTTVSITGAVLVLLLMFQGWVSLPFVNKLIDWASSEASSSAFGLGTAEIATLYTDIIKSSWRGIDLPGLSSGLSAAGQYISNLVSSASSYSSTNPSSEGIQQAISAISVTSVVLMVIFVIWAVCVVLLLVGLILRLAKGKGGVLTVGLVATAVFALICVIGLLVINAHIDAGVASAIESASNSTVVSAYQAARPFIMPGVGAIGSLVASIVTLVATKLVRE